jgi:O-antigen ligase
MFKVTSYICEALSGRKIDLFSVLNYTIPILMGTYIFLNPMRFSFLRDFCFYFSFLALIILLYFRKTTFTLRSPLTLSFILFFLWAVFGLLFTLDFKNTLHDLRRHLLTYLIVFYLLINYFNSQKKLEILSLIIIVSSTFFSMGVIIEYYFIEGFSFVTRLGLTFKEMHTDYIGFITVFAITLALNRLQTSKTVTDNLLFSFCILLMCITTLLTQSRGSLIGIFVSLVVLCFGDRKIIIVITIVLLLAFLMPGLKERFDYQQVVNNERNKINHLTIEIIKAYPVTGIGFGMQIYGNEAIKFNSQLPEAFRQETILPSPHNTILDITVRTGFIGLALFLNILLSSLFILWKTLKLTKNEYFRSWAICLFACFMSFLIAGLFADTTFGARAVVFYTILAMTTILWNLTQQEKMR